MRTRSVRALERVVQRRISEPAPRRARFVRSSQFTEKGDPGDPPSASPKIFFPFPKVPMKHRERDDDYGNITAQLGPDNRVILCPEGLQWIVQRKGAGIWRSLHYCTSRAGVIRRVRGLPGWEALEALPDRAGTVSGAARSAKSSRRASSLPAGPVQALCAP